MRVALTPKPLTPPPGLAVRAAIALRRSLLRAAEAVVPARVAILERVIAGSEANMFGELGRLGVADLLEQGPLNAHEISLGVVDWASEPAMSDANKLHGYFETEIFRSQLDDAELDGVVLGGDCANWFESHLADTVEAGEPIEDDFGWVLPVTVGGTSLWLMLQKWHTTEHGWHIWIEPRGILARVQRARAAAGMTELRNAIDRLAADEPRMGSIRWVFDPKELE